MNTANDMIKPVAASLKPQVANWPPGFPTSYVAVDGIQYRVRFDKTGNAPTQLARKFDREYRDIWLSVWKWPLTDRQRKAVELAKAELDRGNQPTSPVVCNERTLC
jgi:hypothetical protein